MAISTIGNNGLDQSNLDLGLSGNVGIGTATPTAKLDITKATNGNAIIVNAPGGATPNFTVQGSGEQTFRLYNSASSGSTRTSIKLASRLNTDWSWIVLTDSADNGTDDLIVSSTTAGVFGADGNGTFRFNSGFGSIGKAYGCRAWVNFNGTGTIAIRGSGNVSSLTDLGNGYYGVNLTTQMPDTNYNIVTSCWLTSAQNALEVATSRPVSVSQFYVVTGDNNTELIRDEEFVSAAVFR